MNREDVRHWIAGFEAIAEADREALRRQGPDPAWAIAVSLSLIEAARASEVTASGEIPAWREAEDEAVRRVWRTLRRRRVG